MVTEEQYRKAYLMFLSAKGFMSTADMVKQVGKDGFKLFTYYAYPLTVNSAFACELFMKVLITLEDNSYGNTHKLRKLYDILSESKKNEIKALYAKSQCKESVESLIDRYDNAFVEWRYPFEENNNNKALTMAWTDFLNLVLSLQVICKETLKSFTCFDDFDCEGGN